MNSSQGESAIDFPALWVNQDQIYMIDKLDTMSQCTKLGFKKGCYKDVILIDSGFRKFTISSARKLRTIVGLNFDRLFGFLVGNPLWQVELSLSLLSAKSSLDEVKRLISASFKRDKYVWEEMTNFEEFRDKVAAATSMETLFEAFKEFNQA